MTVIVDTNVILVANRQHENVSEACVVACAQRLHEIMSNGRFVLDSDFLILSEYQNKTSPRAGKRMGDQFVKWVLRNNCNLARCDQIPVVKHRFRGFESFPDDRQLDNFDPSDRKFVAVACAHKEHPPIEQAADSKWLGWAFALQQHGVTVDFLCPDDIERFDIKKKAGK